MCYIDKYNLRVGKTALECFKKYFPKTHYNKITRTTKMSAVEKCSEEVHYRPVDIKRFYGRTQLSCYKNVLRKNTLNSRCL